MKKILTVIVLSAFILPAFAQTSVGKKATAKDKEPVVEIKKGPAIKFDVEVHDFGIVKLGDQAVYTFEFINIGSEPLVITNVERSCGCTTPQWTTEPVMPGQKGSVTASYNSIGRPGVFNKAITVITNDSEHNRKVLFIKGDVKQE
jgi:hypothetical protein